MGQMKVGKRPHLAAAGMMFHYHNTTKNHINNTRSNILTQTSSDTLGDALSETMKKLSIRAKKQFKKKIERSRAASYSLEIEISRYQERERDEDEYSIIGLDEIHENEVNNNDIVLDLKKDTAENQTNSFDSFSILRSRSLAKAAQSAQEWDDNSVTEFIEEEEQAPEE